MNTQLLEHKPSDDLIHKVQQHALSDKIMSNNGGYVSSPFDCERLTRLASIGKTVKDLNELNTYLQKYGACIYMTEDNTKGLRYRWKFHNYTMSMYMWVTDRMLSDIMDRQVYSVIVMRQAEKYFLENPKHKRYKHD